MKAVWSRDAKIARVTFRGRSLDVRFDGVLPFSIRHGHRTDCRAFRIPVIGWAVVVGGVRCR